MPLDDLDAASLALSQRRPVLLAVVERVPAAGLLLRVAVVALDAGVQALFFGQGVSKRREKRSCGPGNPCG